MAQEARADRIESCHDGDTCRVELSDGTMKVRLDGIDAPEIDQPLGVEARNFLLSIVGGREVDLVCGGSHGSRETCEIYVEGNNILFMMVQAGLAYDFPQHSGGKYRDAEAEARNAHRGVWSDPTSVSPYCWRQPQIRACKRDRLHQP